MKLFLRLFQFLFGCRHHHLSRVFTIKQRTYKVCFDCGREFDLPAAQAPKRLDAASTGGLGTSLNDARCKFFDLVRAAHRFSHVSYLAQTHDPTPVILNYLLSV